MENLSGGVKRPNYAQKWSIVEKGLFKRIEIVYNRYRNFQHTDKGEDAVRRIAAMIAAMVLAMLMLTAAFAEDGAYRMAGFDTASSGHDWENNLFFSRMEKITGISFTFDQTTSSAEDWKEHLAQLMADADKMPDVLFKAELSAAETGAYYEQGKLIDLKPYLAEHAPNLSALFAAHPEWEKACTLPGGQIVALPGINELQNNNAVWINTVWLRNVRKEMPTTAEELTDVLRAFRDNDPNLNGRRDEKPVMFTSLWDLRFLGQAFGVISNDYYVRLAEDGSVVFTADSDENRAFLSWLHQLWQEGLLDDLGFSAPDTTRAITDAKADITYGVVFGPSVMNVLPSEQLGNYDVLMPLTYAGRNEYRDFLGTVISGTFAVTSACKDPAAMIRWADYLYGTEGSRLVQAGLPDVEYTMLSDGSWSWVDDPTTVANTVLKEIVIVGGADMPGYFDAQFQLAYDDEATHWAVAMLYALKQQSIEPYPNVCLTKEKQSRVQEIWAKLGPMVELAQVHFITGDQPLNDETWAVYCQTIRDLGRDEFVSIWQEAAR